jgi:ADP-dependent NAD(P)H-hydrate dehydratase / NAD(P)H-hydrate epimerase
MTDLPIPLYSAHQVRELDRRAIEVYGIPGAELMTRAGAAAFRAMQVRFPRARRIAVVCGPGNNGGDGYVVARLAQQSGLEAFVLSIGAPRPGGAAATMRALSEAAGVSTQPFDPARMVGADLIVDALLGIGLERETKGEWRAAIDAMNNVRCPIVAVDVPSGLCADTGTVMGAAVRAAVTVSFIGLKPGLFTADGPHYAGEVLFDDLDVAAEVYAGVAPAARRITLSEIRGVIPRRARNAHKGRFGHVLVIGGGKGMSGAARLCGEAALRAGAGLVTIATHPDHAAPLNAGRPELLVYGVRSARDLAPLIERATVIALGPGLSQDAWARGLWRTALASNLPLVVDADALNLLAAADTSRKRDWILTPHPGEAARLLKTKTDAVQRDRFAATKKLTKRFGGVCVLKGAGTLVASDAGVWLCDRGNVGLASGGTGDVLTGVIAALRAQGASALDAARLSVWLHAVAGDDAATQGEAGCLATDLCLPIRQRLNELARDHAPG